MTAAAMHTPGPWKIHKISKSMTITGNVHQVTTGDRYPTAFVPAWDAPLPGETDGTVEALANARLIAAAPDLLTELDVRASDLVMLQRAIEEGDPKGELLIRVGDMLRETRAALAKVNHPTA